MSAEQIETARNTPDDESCMEGLVRQEPEALKPLFTRYAPLVFHIASQSLGPDTAEDIVQDVFLSVWRKADTFDPRRGSFRSWLLQIVHYRILNELRSRSRRPKPEPDPQGELLGRVADPDGEPSDLAWQSYRQEAVRRAVDRLPPAQRQALSLAFFDELTHDQVAATLNLPLGTVKTRIRAGMLKLRFLLAPLGVAVLAMAVIGAATARITLQRVAVQRSERALLMDTASDITVIRVPPVAGPASQTHGSYRGRPGTPMAILALHYFPPAPAGKVYQAWVRTNGAWTSMGVAFPDVDGMGVVVGEGNAYRVLPQAIEVTEEPRGGSLSPTGPPVIYLERP